ncbi:hypothetical protein ABH920_009259 [Catenulispora sp. EB89]
MLRRALHGLIVELDDLHGRRLTPNPHHRTSRVLEEAIPLPSTISLRENSKRARKSRTRAPRSSSRPHDAFIGAGSARRLPERVTSTTRLTSPSPDSLSSNESTSPQPTVRRRSGRHRVMPTSLTTVRPNALSPRTTAFTSATTPSSGTVNCDRPPLKTCRKLRTAHTAAARTHPEAQARSLLRCPRRNTKTNGSIVTSSDVVSTSTPSAAYSRSASPDQSCLGRSHSPCHPPR